MTDENGLGMALDAKGGGDAAAAGMKFQAEVGAYFAVHLLAGRSLDERLDLGDARVASFRMETEAPVDDIVLETTAGGYVFIQAKTAVSASKDPGSPIGRTAEQFVRQWLASRSGVGRRGWDRPLDPARDRLALVVGPRASATISRDLAQALRSRRTSRGARLSRNATAVLDEFRVLLATAWRPLGGDPDPGDLEGILALTSIVMFDFEAAHGQLAAEILRPVVSDAASAGAAFGVLVRSCQGLMATRSGANESGLRTALAAAGVPLAAPPRFEVDVERLRTHTERVHENLCEYEETRVGGADIRIGRECTEAVVGASATGSLLLVGEPGAGKSAVLNAASARLRARGDEVVELAVDRLPVESWEGLRAELGLVNPLVDVLRNWPGTGPAFLMIDALDATRGGSGEAVFRALMAAVIEMPEGRWRVIASIRSFDLRMGEQLKTLFRGHPPVQGHADPAFANVRHVLIPPWTDGELDELLARAPEIGTAVSRGGDGLRDLARVPFNTRLLADLITGGLAANAFGEIDSQVQLLDLYWRHRVAGLGAGAELCVREAVSEMVAHRALRASRTAVARTAPDAFDGLLHESVLTPQSGHRYVAFRHHILFDYSASRLYLDPSDPAELVRLLRAEGGLGLMLGPAVVFVLQELWAQEPRHAEFWDVTCRLAGDADSDPVVRSIAARTGATLPRSGGDFGGLLSCLVGTPRVVGHAAKAFSHIVGAFVIRAEDAGDVPTEAWCHLAAWASEASIDAVAWPLRALLHTLVGRARTQAERRDLGTASRRLLDHALAQPPAAKLAVAAIGFVADTYESDPAASRELLGRLFEPARFDLCGHEDIPWLAHKIDAIGRVDPDFAVEVYRFAFGARIHDSSRTRMGDSQILALSSNRRQDFEMAHYSLKKFLPDFLKSHPVHGTDAVLAAAIGCVASEHPLAEDAVEVAVSAGGRTVRLVEDVSRIWAWDPESEHDDCCALLKALVTYLREAPSERASEIIDRVMATNALAVVWARVFLAAISRPEELGSMLWPVASQPEFVLGQDTRKDAIDLIAARYPYEAKATREAFERAAIGWHLPSFEIREDARAYVLERLFATIGHGHLVTDEARAFAAERPPGEASDPSDGNASLNRRPYEFHVRSGEAERWGWLRRAGVDLDAPANAEQLAAAEAFERGFEFAPGTANAADVEGATDSLARFAQVVSTGAGSGASKPVLGHSAGLLAERVGKVASASPDALRQVPGALRSLIALVGQAATHENPGVSAETEASFEKLASWGSPAPRVDAADAVMNLCRVDAAVVEELRPTIEALLWDAHPAVRMSVAQRLNLLWDTARPSLWTWTDQVVDREANRGVLRFFANSVLHRLVHADPERTEEVVSRLLDRVRDQDRSEEPTQSLLEEIASLVTLLWVSHGRTWSRDLLRRWVADLHPHETEIHQALFVARGALVLGYDTGLPRDAAIRARGQELSRWVADAAAGGLEAYWADDAAPPDPGSAQSYAKALNQVCDQLYFASGAFRQGDEDRGLADNEEKVKFLRDVRPTLMRIADAGTPATIHHLLALSEFLVAADPPVVFDIVTHALLGAGRRHGYQFESLGADQFVTLVGRFLADHRTLFVDEARRRALVSALDAFIEAGWPSARRLLYRLPELLQ